jgi:hypothetical protein
MKGAPPMSKGMMVALAIIGAVAAVSFVLVGVAFGTILPKARLAFFGFGGLCAVGSVLSVAALRGGEHEGAGPSAAASFLHSLSRLRSLLGIIRWFLVGLGCIVVGSWMIFSPDFRSNPKQFTLADAAPGVAAILVGLVMVGLPLILRRWRR